MRITTPFLFFAKQKIIFNTLQYRVSYPAVVDVWFKFESAKTELFFAAAGTAEFRRD
jgi:hypothetical protein